MKGTSARHCHLCGRPARGRSLRHAAWPPGVALHVCDDCLATKPRCPVCRLPGNAAGRCPTCHELGPVCAGCGRRIRRRVAYVDEHGPYCVDCMAGPRCGGCGLPAGALATPAPGRVACASCRASTVVDQGEAVALFRAVEGIIGQQLGLSLNVPTGLLLVGPEELDALLADLGEAPTGDADTLGVYTRRGRRRGIYALAGLPRLLLLQVAAHEWAHAWQMESAPLLRDPLLREGFAEWVAYRVLHALGEHEAAGRALGRDDQYGEGLRYLLALEAQVGAPGVVDWCRRARPGDAL